jgi:hypothetical protein
MRARMIVAGAVGAFWSVIVIMASAALVLVLVMAAIPVLMGLTVSAPEQLGDQESGPGGDQQQADDRVRACWTVERKCSPTAMIAAPSTSETSTCVTPARPDRRATLDNG